MQWIVLCLSGLLFSFPVFSHEITSVTQHVNVRKFDEIGWQQDLIGRLNVNRKFDVGFQGTYMERFDIYDKRLGGFVTARPTDGWTFEARYLQGMGNEILPEKDVTLSAFHSLTDGISPFAYYRDSRFSVTHLHMGTLGVEIEKIPHFVFIPMVSFGKATFKDPAETDDVHTYGLNVIYYQEKNYSFSLFAYKGKEASQAIVGASTQLVNTLTGGASVGYYFNEDWRGQLVFDHADYDELETEFHTTTLNLSRMF